MFYSIVHSNEKKVIGHYPQLKSLDYDTELVNVMLYNQIPDIPANVEIEFYKSSRKTDLVNNSPLWNGLLVSEKFKNTISDLNLSEHRFYPVKVKNNLLINDKYFWFRFYHNLFQYIDLNKTVFKWYNDDPTPFSTISEFKVESKEEFRRCIHQQRWDKHIAPVKIILTKDFPNYDIFSLDIISALNIVSEKFANRIISTGVTGFALREYPIIELNQ